jgi:hypothetical protein
MGYDIIWQEADDDNSDLALRRYFGIFPRWKDTGVIIFQGV